MEKLPGLLAFCLGIKTAFMLKLMVEWVGCLDFVCLSSMKFSMTLIPV